jgi:hypothetical protein
MGRVDCLNAVQKCVARQAAQRGVKVSAIIVSALTEYLANV